MKQFVIDELRPADYRRLKTHLDTHYGSGGVDGIYWIPLEAELLSAVQAEHKQCQPFYFAIDLEAGRIAVELLVRTKSRMRCACMAYATENQCIWLIRLFDDLFKQLEVKS
jgi:hypothetical protein